MTAIQDTPYPFPARPRISVVIPHLNQPEFLARCLASWAAGVRAPDEEIVVDNDSHTLPEAICAAHRARLLTEAEPGPGQARNLVVAVSFHLSQSLRAPTLPVTTARNIT
jgi:GT2 family glycosyltransferase